MKDTEKTKAQLIEELVELRQRMAEPERVAIQRQRHQALLLAVHQLRDSVWRMGHAEDIKQVTLQLKSCLENIDMPHQVFGINVVEDVSVGDRFYAYLWVGKNEVVRASLTEKENATIKTFWQGKKTIYRPDIQTEDLYGEAAYLQHTRSVLDVPFSHGTIALSSPRPNAFTERDIEAFQALAEVMSEGFLRMADLQNLEQQNRELASKINERKQVEEELQKVQDELEQRVEERTAALRLSQERLAEILDSAHDAIISIDAKEKIIQFNQGAVRIFGYEMEDVLGQPLTILIPEEYRDIHHRHTEAFSSSPQRARAMGERQEISGRRKNGEIFPAEASISKLSTSIEVIFTVILRDISERKQAEDALRKSEEEFRDLYENAPIAYSSIDHNGLILRVNRSWGELLGYVPDEVVGQPILDFYADTSMGKERARQVLKRFQEGEDVRGEEVELCRIDGQSVWISLTVHPIRDERGRVVASRSMSVDITERKQAMREHEISFALQRVRNEILQMKNEGDWRTIIRALDKELQEWIQYHTCGISILDVANNRKIHYTIVDGEIEYVEIPNVTPILRHVLETKVPLHQRTRAEIEQWQGYPSEEIHSNVDVPFPGGALAINSIQENAFDEQDISILEQFAPMVAEGVRRLKDLNELASREEQLRQAQKMEAVGQLTAGIAHNFNNRLMVISTAIESLQLRETFDPVELEIAASSVEQAAKMVTQLMLFSRSEGEGEFKPIQVREIFSDVGEIGHKSFDRKIALIDEIPRDLPLISGDSTQLEQVFLNLLLNARDAVEEGNASSPSIRMVAKVVSIGEEDQPADLVSRQRDYLRIDIIDNGVGMNEETQQRVFEPFFTTKEVDKGTGLGLATVYAIVKDHQGWIECESQVGVGTAFSVYLPITEQEIGPSDDEQAKTIPRGTETILLIEDEADLRDQQVSIFKQYGYEVLVGKDGQEGWETFEREWEHVDVVLLDLSMPNLSGQEILARMLTLNPDVKVIVSTGYTQHSADAMGVQALLKKPYRITQVLQTIREVLDSNQ